MKINEISTMTQNIILNDIKQSINSFFNFDIKQFEIYYHQKIRHEINSKNKSDCKYTNSFNKKEFHQINALAVINNTSNTLSIKCIYSKNGIKKYRLIIKGNTTHLLKILNMIKFDHKKINGIVNDYFKLINALDKNESIKSDILLSGTMNIEFTKYSGTFYCSHIVFEGEKKFESNLHRYYSIISASTSQGASTLLSGIISNDPLIKNYDFNVILENNMYIKIESNAISDRQKKYPFLPNFLSSLNNNNLDEIVQLVEMIKY